MIHALLRLTLLAVNVLDTFKILQPPKPRKGGTEPSARALAARKRGMKGTLCVWIVTVSAPHVMRCWVSVLNNALELGVLALRREHQR